MYCLHRPVEKANLNARLQVFAKRLVTLLKQPCLDRADLQDGLLNGTPGKPWVYSSKRRRQHSGEKEEEQQKGGEGREGATEEAEGWQKGADRRKGHKPISSLGRTAS